MKRAMDLYRWETWETGSNKQVLLFQRLLLQRFNDGAIDLPEEDEGENYGHAFRDGEGPPDIGDNAGLREEPGGGEQDDQLSSEGDDQGVDTL